MDKTNLKYDPFLGIKNILLKEDNLIIYEKNGFWNPFIILLDNINENIKLNKYMKIIPFSIYKRIIIIFPI